MAIFVNARSAMYAMLDNTETYDELMKTPVQNFNDEIAAHLKGYLTLVEDIVTDEYNNGDVRICDAYIEYSDRYNNEDIVWEFDGKQSKYFSDFIPALTIEVVKEMLIY